jgi:light-regulated signal transduction histidine kinase (bacteriophytochrome)
MQQLLSDLLDYTRAAGISEISDARTDIRSAVEKALQNLQASIASSGAQVLYGDLPVTVGAESHFVQLFQNLVGNAIQYRAVESPVIAISASLTNAEWLFSVKDNGIGIAPQHHPIIFGVFKRLHGRNIPGTGIGLAICQKIVERYGGRIWVESELGHGAEFLFTIPLHPPRR